MRFVLGIAAAFSSLLALGALALRLEAPIIAFIIWTLCLTLLSVLFCRLREKDRVWYGGFEFIVVLVGFFLVLKSLHENLAGGPVLTRMGLLFASV
jgi:hypothetical protein